MNQYKPYAEYKESGVEWLGAVPSHWSLTPIKRFARVENGRDYTDVYEDNGAVPIYGSGGQFSTASTPLYSGESVLIGRKGTLDKPLHVNGPFWTVDTMFYTRLFDTVHGRYLYYSIVNYPFSLYSTNTALPSLTQSAISEHKISAPPLPEQHAIATFLDRETAKIDALIEKKSKFIELLEEKRQALISHAVTKGLNPDAPMKDSGVPWLGEVPAHWEVMKIKNVTRRLSSGVSVNAENTPASAFEIGVLKTSSVSKNVFIPSENKRVITEELERVQCSVEQGSLIISRMNTPQLVGRCGYVETSLPNLFLPDRLWKVETRTHLDPKFFHLWTFTPFYQDTIASFANGTSSSMQNLSQPEFASIPILVPPLEEQESLIKALQNSSAHIEAVVGTTRHSITLLREKRSALITAAVTGQIDVRDEVAS